MGELFRYCGDNGSTPFKAACVRCGFFGVDSKWKRLPIMDTEEVEKNNKKGRQHVAAAIESVLLEGNGRGIGNENNVSVRYDEIGSFLLAIQDDSISLDGAFFM